ncbi:PaaI family thioesterase [Congregibacter brevis]|uniref:PaaI family thioesterase n=1 Tax=Congregibacter brevis TaxID=3081201 RepID=A0ABZ0I837_9GAMM|nr:PaaI family thioesterase [Congregibacter sp. IMCC45268]
MAMEDQDSVSASVPEGFVLVPDGMGFADSLRPFYRRVVDKEVSFGMLVEEKHLNPMGIVHGGALMTLADIAAANSIRVLRDKPAASPTINLSFDFMAPGRLGHWLETRADHVQAKRRFGFCSGAIFDGDKAILRYSGTFYCPDHGGLVVTNDNTEQAKFLLGDDAP